MNEHISGGAAGAAAGWKVIGGTAGALGIGAMMATIVVMIATRPRTASEWAVGLICTVIGSICGGAAVIMHWQLQSWMYSFTGLIALLGLAFACGLPAWALVRWVFTYIEKRRSSGIDEVISEAKKVVL